MVPAGSAFTQQKRLRGSSIRDGLAPLYAQDVAHYPPDAEKQQIGVDGVGMLKPTLQPGTQPARIATAAPDQAGRIRDGNHEKEVVGIGFRKPAMQRGVDGALQAAPRTAPSREQSKRTLRHERKSNGVQTIKSDPDE